MNELIANQEVKTGELLENIREGVFYFYYNSGLGKYFTSRPYSMSDGLECYDFEPNVDILKLHIETRENEYEEKISLSDEFDFLKSRVEMLLYDHDNGQKQDGGYYRVDFNTGEIVKIEDRPFYTLNP